MTTATTAEQQDLLSNAVAEEIRAMLARKRMSGRELALALGVSPAWVSYRLVGKQPIDLNDLQRIARVLGVKVVSLLPEEVRSGTGQKLCSVPKSKRPGGTRKPRVDNRPKGRPEPRGHAAPSAERISTRRPKRLGSVTRPMPTHPA